MKLCIPSSEPTGLDAPSGEHFGRARWFYLVETNDGTYRTIANPSCHTHGGSCHHADMLTSLGVQAVVGAQIGRNARAGLRAAGIEVLDADGSTVRDVADAVRGGRAQPAADVGCGQHQHGEGIGRRGHGHDDGQEHGSCGQHRHGHGHGHGHDHGPSS